ncbi:VOC family protein [Bradyrhizobium erythrophlei]|uniref:VOC family protein n=1 Tax=Bradyrhizobium erythrophlei TaxID=1437360 RepID=UPI0035EFEA67
MPRGLDHIVHTARDVDALGEFYRRAGFTVGAHNRHPWGTHNRIVQMPGFFIELLDVAEPQLIEPHRPGQFSFGACARDFLAREEGLAMLVLEGRGAANDADAFRRAGIGDFKVFDFEREARRPDGSAVKVAFSLAFATDASAPDNGYFTCQQHYPQNFWNPAFQAHGNGVTGVNGVVIVSPNPQDQAHFIQAFSGEDEVASGPDGLTAVTPRGEIEVIHPDAYRARTGAEPPKLGRGARLAAIRLAVRQMAETMSVLRNAGIPALDQGGKAVIPAPAAHGATLIFEPAKQG